MKKEYTPQNIILSSRFIDLWRQESDPFRKWTLQRVGELIADNPDHCTSVTFVHMRNLFTAIAIHEWDLAHGMSETASIDRLGKSMEDFMLPSRRKFQKLLKHKWVFKTIGPIIPRLMTKANGKGFNSVPVSITCGFGFDTTECPFNDLMSRYGHPNLGKRFCAIDEYMYGHIPNVRFERQGTLCRGCDRCDFRFYWKKQQPSPAMSQD